jgi:hypothetical protein
MSKKSRFIEKVIEENYNRQTDLWFRTNYISREKLELFHDFIITLTTELERTYLGTDIITTDELEKIHFTWCWNKTIDSFSNERIIFKKTGNHFNYFFIFYKEAFFESYKTNKKEILLIFFEEIFDFTVRKHPNELIMLGEIYKLLNLALKK